MKNENPNPSINDTALSMMLTVGQLKQLMADAVATATHQNATGEERLLDANQAAELLGLSTDWLYRNAKKLPFTRKIGPKMLRFSYQGMLKWLATRRAS